MSAALFYGFGAVAVIAALIVVGPVRRATTSGFALAVALLALGAVLALLDAHFVAAVQILVYAGSVVVLQLFVLMTLEPRQRRLGPRRNLWLRTLGLAVVALAAIQVWQRLQGPSELEPATTPALPVGFGGHQQLGLALFTDYLLVVEAIPLLFASAWVGALLLAKRDFR